MAESTANNINGREGMSKENENASSFGCIHGNGLGVSKTLKTEIDNQKCVDNTAGDSKQMDKTSLQTSRNKNINNDSGISTSKIDCSSTSEAENSSENSAEKSKMLSRNSVKKSKTSNDRDSPDYGQSSYAGIDSDLLNAVAQDCQNMLQVEDDFQTTSWSLDANGGPSSSSPGEGENKTRAKKRKLKFSYKLRLNDSTDSDDDSEEQGNDSKDENRNDVADTTLDSDDDDDINLDSSNIIDAESTPKQTSDDEEYIPKTKHKWFLTKEIVGRELGKKSHFSQDLFRLRAYGSLHMVERMELMAKMKQHEGCVNTLHFNSSGTRLASGSDDLKVVIWDWTISKPTIVYDSGHRSNVFQAKFMPLGADCHIVSCARDGQVRLAELSTTGVCKSTKRLAQHRGGAHKLALELQTPHTFLSCGEDAVVFEIDLRENKANKMLTCKEGDKKIALYSIHANPINNYEFAVGGRDHFVRIYDKRRICESGSPMKKYCPHHLLNNDHRANVTCVVWNYCGSEILATYNDEDIYTFDTRQGDGAEFSHRYQGHRNNATVKGVNYFGPRSQYIVSGSDCGNIFLWDHDTEEVVQFMAGDEGGVVNCLEPHPQIPVLATSGLDDDVKIWVPSSEQAPLLKSLKKTMRSNKKEREDDQLREPDTFDGQMLWYLMHHLRRTARRRARQDGQHVDDSTSSSDDNSDSDDSEGMSNPVQCAPS